MWDCGADLRANSKAKEKEGSATFSLVPGDPDTDILSDVSVLRKFLFNNEKKEALMFYLLVSLSFSVVMDFFAEVLVSRCCCFETF